MQPSGRSRFVLRAKVKIEDASDVLSVSGQHDTRNLQSAGIATPQSSTAYTEEEGIGVSAVNGDAGRYWVIAAALYALAKVFEFYDREVYSATVAVISGHTLKHFAAAGACLAILIYFKTRRPTQTGQ